MAFCDFVKKYYYFLSWHGLADQDALIVRKVFEIFFYKFFSYPPLSIFYHAKKNLHISTQILLSL